MIVIPIREGILKYLTIIRKNSCNPWTYFLVKNPEQNLFQKFLKIIDTLNKFKVDYIVIGGVAMISHGLPRLTRNLDVIVKMTDKNLLNLRQALTSIYDDSSIEEITLEELNRYSVLRYGTPDNFYLDLMARVGESADFESLEIESKGKNAHL